MKPWTEEEKAQAREQFARSMAKLYERRYPGTRWLGRWVPREPEPTDTDTTDTKETDR
jgi:hypothetical protein